MEPSAHNGRVDLLVDIEHPCPHCGSRTFDPPPADEDTIIRCDECGTEAPQWQFFGHDKAE